MMWVRRGNAGPTSNSSHPTFRSGVLFNLPEIRTRIHKDEEMNREFLPFEVPAKGGMLEGELPQYLNGFSPENALLIESMKTALMDAWQSEHRARADSVPGEDFPS